MNAGQVIVIDWGTSSFRAYRVEMPSGVCVEEIDEGLGMSALQRSQFAGYCRERTAAWRPAGVTTPIYMAGMVGAAQGWQTAPQPPLPISADDIAGGMVAADGLDDAWILPGARCHGPHGQVDIMRGEEVQIFGALAEIGVRDARLCLPGTHSKWATVRDGALVHFATAMTGELYQAILRHTVVGRPAEADAPFDAAAFDHGLEVAALPGGLSHHVFGARGRLLHGDLSANTLPSYLSGLLIGAEIAGMAELEPLPADLLLVCARSLREPYERALARAGVTSTWVDTRVAALRGILSVVRHHVVEGHGGANA